uniref:GBD/FH3 domain-containing protein n=1 Tax=Heterorhabditis bacteriophora TaxID=37862 RepID=A0A1I7XLT5_HETBA
MYDAVTIIVMTLTTTLNRVVSLEILSGLCFVPEEGHRQVLTALTEVSPLLCERTRFQTLIDSLHRSCSSDRETDRLRTAVLGLINALLRTGTAESSVEFRSHLRFELLMLGITRATEAARPTASARLEDHLDLFEMMRNEDEITLSGGMSNDFDSSSPIGFDNAVNIMEALHSKLKDSLALPHFISLIQHLFMVPFDEKHVPLWKLFDLILQHLTLQCTVDGVTDVHQPIYNAVDMTEMLTRLHTHCEYERVERELDKLKEELDMERTRCIEMENRLADLQDGRASISSRLAT